ncbi:MAG: MarR family winged helix-turn-helix transcriptional regulator [Faecousia sp.]
MTEETTCPGCGVGREAGQTGVLPGHGQSKEHPHGMHLQRCHSADMNEKLIFNLRDISRMMRMQYEGKASQKRILIILKEAGTLTQKELTEQLGIQPGSASEILSKLESAGLICRAQNEADRRTTDIALTSSGANLASEAAAQRQKRHEEMFSCLTPEEKAALLCLLEKVHADWEGRFAKLPAQGRPGGQDRRSGRPRGGKPDHGE